MDNVHWVHGQYPLSPWTLSTQSMDNVHSVHGQCPLRPWTMSTKSMDNVHSIHGLFPWVFPTSLAHLSWRLTRWAYSIPMVCCRPHFQTWISLMPVGQSWSNFMCSITGVGERLRKVLGRLDQNSGFHGNRKPPLTYSGENDASTFSQLFLIRSFFILAGNEDMHKISNKFEFRPDRTTDYGVSCPWVS